MDAILDDNKLNDLRTKKIYNKLDNGTEGCQGDTFYNLAKQILNEYNGLQDFSDKILKGLCYAYGNTSPDESDNDICDFLYYWLGDILYDNLTHMIYFDSVMYKLFHILSIRNGKKCTAPTYYNIYEGKNFKNIKLFFDYSKDYDTYEKQITSNNLSCSKNYNEYLKKYVETYKEVQSECQNKPASRYCNAFNDYFDKKLPTLLSTWTCNLQQNKPEAGKVDLESESKEQQPPPTHETQGLSVTLPGGFQGENEQGTEHHNSSVHPLSKGTPEMDSVSIPSDAPPTSTTKTIATTASVAGILVPPFLVYNFTPVRSWINKLLGRKPIYRNPLTERELLENSYQRDHLDSERNRYNISYRPE